MSKDDANNIMNNSSLIDKIRVVFCFFFSLYKNEWEYWHHNMSEGKKQKDYQKRIPKKLS